MKRICAYCGEKILGYPHVTVWDEGPEKSVGVRFHTIKEALLFFSDRAKQSESASKVEEETT